MQIARVTLLFTKATKHTYRYDSDDPDDHVRTLYVHREAFKGKDAPDQITVIVEAPKPETED